MESSKAAVDLILPLSGEVTAINEALEENPRLVNSSPYDEGWMIEVKMDDPEDLEKPHDGRGLREHAPGHGLALSREGSINGICAKLGNSDIFPSITRAAKGGAAILRKFEGSLRETF